MLRCKIVCVGKIKEKFWIQAASEYEKRLSRYLQLEIYEVPDEKAGESLHPAEIEQVKNSEGKRILNKIVDDEYVIALCIEGKTYDSVSWSEHIDQLMTRGISKICFVIGGSNGLSEAVVQRAQEKLSFSSFTFTHQLMRVLLLEQLFRAFKILSNEPYHK